MAGREMTAWIAGLSFLSANLGALAYMHPALWWGALLLALGLFYVIRFHPRPGKRADGATTSPAR